MVSTIRKPLQFMGSSHKDLSAFPAEARRYAGFNLDFVQRGFEPENWKPIKTVGPGVNEIRIRDTTSAYRVIYLATRAEAVYVLHCFRRKLKRRANTTSNWPRDDSRKFRCLQGNDR